MKRMIRASLMHGLVGVWWYDEVTDILIQCKCEVDEGYEDYQGFIQYADNKGHLTEWRNAVKEQLPEKRSKELVNRGYKSIERGRVFYDSINHEYTISCSDRLLKEFPDVIDRVVDDYNLSGCKYAVEVEIHYHLAPLTGNPALDDFEYGNGYF